MTRIKKIIKNIEYPVLLAISSVLVVKVLEIKYPMIYLYSPVRIFQSIIIWIFFRCSLKKACTSKRHHLDFFSRHFVNLYNSKTDRVCVWYRFSYGVLDRCTLLA